MDHEGLARQAKFMVDVARGIDDGTTRLMEVMRKEKRETPFSLGQLSQAKFDLATASLMLAELSISLAVAQNKPTETHLVEKKNAEFRLKKVEADRRRALRAVDHHEMNTGSLRWATRTVTRARDHRAQWIHDPQVTEQADAWLQVAEQEVSRIAYTVRYTEDED